MLLGTNLIKGGTQNNYFGLNCVFEDGMTLAEVVLRDAILVEGCDDEFEEFLFLD